MNKYSYFDQKQINSDSEENYEYDPQHNIRLKMEKIIKLYFIKEPSLLIYFIIEDEKKIEKIDLNSIDKNKINLEIKNWKKILTKNSLIQNFLEVIKSNNIKDNNLNQILEEINYNNNIEENSLSQSDIKINTSNEISENEESESLFLDNSIISIENILNLNVNKNKEKEKRKYNIINKDDELESSCDAEYFESINFLPLDEFQDIEMQNTTKDKENNTDNIKKGNKISNNRNKLGNEKNFSGMDFLKKKTKNSFSNNF
jgi:hypothetical protein